MQKVSTVFLSNDPMYLDYEDVQRTISEKWEKKARDLQKRRWRYLGQVSLEEKQ